MPSLTQMILPQLRQLGAAARRGCLVALQEQARDGVGSLVREGLFWSSRARMAESWHEISQRMGITLWKAHKILQCRGGAMHRRTTGDIDFSLRCWRRGSRAIS